MSGSDYDFLGQPSTSLSGALTAWGTPRQYTPEGFDPMWGLGGGNAPMSWQDRSDKASALYYESLPGLKQQELDLLKQAQPGAWGRGAQMFGDISKGLAGLGNMYLGYQQMKQQKKAFEFNKGVMNTNLNNSIMDYNRRLGDTLANRALNNGQGSGWVSQELAKYSAKRST